VTNGLKILAKSLNTIFIAKKVILNIKMYIFFIIVKRRNNMRQAQPVYGRSLFDDNERGMRGKCLLKNTDEN
jgi:hypothetical protein